MKKRDFWVKIVRSDGKIIIADKRGIRDLGVSLDVELGINPSVELPSDLNGIFQAKAELMVKRLREELEDDMEYINRKGRGYLSELLMMGYFNYMGIPYLYDMLEFKSAFERLYHDFLIHHPIKGWIKLEIKSIPHYGKHMIIQKDEWDNKKRIAGRPTYVIGVKLFKNEVKGEFIGYLHGYEVEDKTKVDLMKKGEFLGKKQLNSDIYICEIERLHPWHELDPVLMECSKDRT